MEHSLQVELARELFEHIDAGTTCLANDVATNPIVSYTDPSRLDRELKILFRPSWLPLPSGQKSTVCGLYIRTAADSKSSAQRP